MTTRQMLVDRLRVRYPDLSHEDLLEAVRECFDYMTSELANGKKIELRGFGVLSVGKRDVVSPLMSKKKITRKVLQYKASKNIQDAINLPTGI